MQTLLLLGGVLLFRIRLRGILHEPIEGPVLVVANKNDQFSVRQDYILQPQAFCHQHRLPPPHPSCSTAPPRRDIYTKLATMAAYP